MADWNPFIGANIVAGELLAVAGSVFGLIVFLLLLKKIVKMSKG